MGRLADPFCGAVPDPRAPQARSSSCRDEGRSGYAVIMQQQRYGLLPGGIRLRLVTFCLGLIGAIFIAVGTWAFLLPAAADIRAGRTVRFTATRAGITWSRVYAFRDHPGDFTLWVLTKILGGVGFGSLGLFVGFACLLRALGPATIEFSPREKRISTYWVFGSAALIALYFLLWTFPYLLRYGAVP